MAPPIKKPFDADSYLETAEIKSHSSMLNNKNLFEMFLISSDQNRVYGDFNNIDLIKLKEFFSTIRSIYDETFMVFSEEENKKIIEIRNKIYEKIFSDWTKLPENKLGEALVSFFFDIEQMYVYIKASLQKQQFFFRKAEANLTGITKALEMFEKRGGIFEKSG